MTLAVALFASGPVSVPAAAATDLRAVASTKPVHSLASAVMDGPGKPHLPIRGKASPHTFSMRPSDAASIADADMVFPIGEAMETALASAIESLGGKARVIALADAKGPPLTGGVGWKRRFAFSFRAHDVTR